MPFRSLTPSSVQKVRPDFGMPRTVRKSVRIAIFDDVAEIVDIYSKYLIPLKDISVLDTGPVASVKEALSIFDAEKPDIVITDLCLTDNGREGFEILDGIRRISPETIVILTSSAYVPHRNDAICREIESKGFDAAFRKSDIKELLKFVSRQTCY